MGIIVNKEDLLPSSGPSKFKLFNNYKYNLNDEGNYENIMPQKPSLKFNDFNVILDHIPNFNVILDHIPIIPSGIPFAKQPIRKPNSGGLEPPNNGGYGLNTIEFSYS